MVIRKVANPAPSVLALVNPRRRKKTMAARKQKSSSKRRTTHRASPRKHNAKRKYTKRRSTRRVYARHRNPINPGHWHHRRHTRRRHRSMNPFGGAGGEIVNFTVAGLAQGIAMPIVGGFVGRFLPFGQFNPPVISLGTGWLLSKLFGMFGFTRRFSHAAMVFGAATAAMQVLQPFAARLVGGVTAPAPAPATMSGWGNGYYNRHPRMRGIGVTTGMPPTITPPPAAPAPAATMSGMGMRPGAYGY
jgi:hypothetical protein